MPPAMADATTPIRPTAAGRHARLRAPVTRATRPATATITAASSNQRIVADSRAGAQLNVCAKGQSVD